MKHGPRRLHTTTTRVGILPTPSDWSAVFYTNHTYTAQVAGFGGGVKRSIGRKLLQKEIVAELQRAQKAIRAVESPALAPLIANRESDNGFSVRSLSRSGNRSIAASRIHFTGWRDASCASRPPGA